MACFISFKIESAYGTVNEYADQMPNLPINLIYCYIDLQNDSCNFVTCSSYILKFMRLSSALSVTTKDETALSYSSSRFLNNQAYRVPIRRWN